MNRASSESSESSGEPLIAARWASFARIVARLYATNPFEPAWDERMREALGEHYRPGDDDGNRAEITQALAPIVAVTAHRLAQGAQGTAEELDTYRRLVLYSLWDDYGPRLQRLVEGRKVDVPFWDDFAKSYRTYLDHPGLGASEPGSEPGHQLALLYQKQRTWYFARTLLLGESALPQATRAALFRASMGGDPDQYAEGLYRHMHEIPVLITGETGSGKDLAARVLGWSRYIPFDVASKRFAGTHDGDYHARSLCEVSPGLFESELCGHKKGAFTGATANKVGLFGLAGPHGTIFLDEIGELSLEAQAKLLRPCENREYTVLGETRTRPIQARIIVATNKDLEAECEAKRFRRDLYERFNVVRVHMESLRAIRAEARGEVRVYVRGFVAKRVEGAARVERMTDRIYADLCATRPDDPWTGNMRALEHHVEHFIVTDGRMSAPAAVAPVIAPAVVGMAAPAPAVLRAAGPVAPESAVVVSSEVLGRRVKEGKVTVYELLRAYATWMFMLAGLNRSETARRTGLTWRKVGSLIDPVRLARWLARRKQTPPLP